MRRADDGARGGGCARVGGISTVGTLAGQMIVQGFVGFRIPIWVRRLVTMIPAFIVVGLGADATNALVISQVVLSITLPLPMIALLIFTQSGDIMGRFANGRLTNAAAIVQCGRTLIITGAVRVWFVELAQKDAHPVGQWCR
jgi:manganese transport protein